MNRTPASPAKDRAHTWSRWLAIGAVFLSVAELSARIDDAVIWSAPLFSPYTEDWLMIRDSLGVRGRPNYRFRKWRMNNEGFRGSDMRVAPAPGTSRVVLLGASDTFGMSESEGHEYPARMQAMLDSLAPGRFDVVNAALPGMSVPAMTRYYQQVVARIRPSFVFVYPSPSFYLFLDPPRPVYVPPPSSRTDNPGKIDAELFQSRLIAQGREAVKELIPAALLTYSRERYLRRVRAEHDPSWFWTSVPADRMVLFGRDLDRLVATIQAAGATVILVTHTNRFVGATPGVRHRDRRHLVSLLAKDYPRASADVLVAVDSAANSHLRDIARERHAAVVEAEGRIPPTGQYFADYTHFTDDGAGVMARLLTAGLLRLAAGADTSRAMTFGDARE